MTDTREHPDWCAKDHQCGLGEHRAQPVSLHAPGRGVLVLTRVRSADGHEHVEVRTRIRLAPGESQARAHLARILAELQAHLRRVTAVR
jgi:hypothetical protein